MENNNFNIEANEKRYYSLIVVHHKKNIRSLNTAIKQVGDKKGLLQLTSKYTPIGNQTKT